MRSEVIQADTIDAAVERILEELKDDTSTRSSRNRENVIYFDGWDGLGASSVLQAIAQRLGASSDDPKEELAQVGLHFEQIIHIDCTKWQSRRAMQRLIAVKLGLPDSVMEVLDKQDEEDDYHGVDPGSRAEIPEVVREIYQRLQNLRFLVLFHNGSSEEIDLANYGFPLQDLGFPLYSRNRVLWTFQGSFHLKPKMKIDRALSKSTGMTTGVFLSASHHERGPQELWSHLVLKEAEEVARKNNTGCITEPAQVAGCFLYMLKQCCLGQHLVDYDLATHGGNYWVCDGIIQQLQKGQGESDNDGSWRDAAALKSEIQLDVEYYQHRHHQYVNLQRCAEIMPYWSSPPYLLIPVGASAFLNEDVFKHFNTLGVLKLSHCNFSFSSPPFLCCHKLKFLWLEHCQDQAIGTDGAAEKEEDIQRCFQQLWVLDVRYTRCDWILSARMLEFMSQLRELNVKGTQDWDIGQLQGRLPNIRKLRVTQSTVSCSNCSENNLILGMNKMELLEFSGNRATMLGVANISLSASSNELVTVMIIDGCVGIKNFSFKGCAKLKHILLSGLFEDLRILDLSGTAIKMLDLSAMIALNLDGLFLDGCEKLCAILWPPQDKRKGYLQKLHIDINQSLAASSVELHGARAPSDYYWYISTKDARLLQSIVPFRNYFNGHSVHVEISSPNCHAVDVRGSRNDVVIRNVIAAGGEQPNMQRQQPNDIALVYADVSVTIKGHLFQASQGYGNAQTITQTWPCPVAPKLGSSNCYMYIQDKAMMNKSPPDHEEYATGNSITIPDFVCDRAWILHVHDSLFITSIPGHAPWEELRWCLVERCPKLEFIFTVPQLGTEQGGGGSKELIFIWLNTLWISQLPKARFMWDMSKLSLGQISGWSFENLKLLHLDFCPRLIHVLPFSMPIISRRYLETIEIVWCGNLRTIFPLHSDTEIHQEQQQTPGATTVEFPHLKRIHLHELPKLKSFCGSGRMYAPKLETVKIRGCWSLTRLPAIYRNRSNKVECDCEKDWWARLQWDGLQANHHYSLYKPTHPRYYKKILLRGSVLV